MAKWSRSTLDHLPGQFFQKGIDKIVYVWYNSLCQEDVMKMNPLVPSRAKCARFGDEKSFRKSKIPLDKLKNI
jgi:hypothetical protein